MSCEFQVAFVSELPPHSALAAEQIRPYLNAEKRSAFMTSNHSVSAVRYLRASCMLDILVVELEPHMIIRMNHLMGHRILHIISRHDMVLTQQDTPLRREAARHRARAERVAPSADNVAGVHAAAQLVDVVLQVSQVGRIGQQPVPVPNAALVLLLFVYDAVHVHELGCFFKAGGASVDFEFSAQ